MEPFLADFLKNTKVPKPVRCLLAISICAVVVFVGVICVLQSPFFWGKIFGVVLAATFCSLGVYICAKIIKS